MDPAQWRRVRDALAAALDLRPDERPGYLDAVGAGDPGLRAGARSSGCRTRGVPRQG
jgi:hypothetical protein